MAARKTTSSRTHKTPQSAAKKDARNRPQPLFRTRFKLSDSRCLHFVRNCPRRPDGSRRTFWAPNLQVGEDRLSAEYRGKRFAAAYMIYLRHNGMLSLPLTWILQDMGTQMDDGVAIGFLDSLQQCAWTVAARMMPAEFEEHTEDHRDRRRL
jgi:hypothetical protein